MGSRDDDELDEPVDATLAAEDEQATRQLLARYDQPFSVAPPPGLAARTSLVLAREMNAGATPRPRSPWFWQLAAFGLGLLVMLGLWGVFGQSSGPANLLGGTESGGGRALLWLTLAAKPLINAVLSLGSVGLLASIVLLVCAWLWWRLINLQPPTALLEQRL
jgi:hypothetical protein